MSDRSSSWKRRGRRLLAASTITYEIRLTEMVGRESVKQVRQEDDVIVLEEQAADVCVLNPRTEEDLLLLGDL